MATFLKRNNRWRVQIRRTGYPSITKTFAAKADAQAWARDKERQIDRGELPTNHHELKAITVGDLLQRYRDTITPKKRGQQSERYMLGTIASHPLSQVHLSRLKPADIAQYRDERARSVTPSSVLRELAILSHMFTLAMKDWGIPLASNPVTLISKPAPNKARDRRLEEGELERLEAALSKVRNPYIKPAFFFAIHTGMRRGELLSLTWANVDLTNRTAYLPLTKNGHSRTVPLSGNAIDVLKELSSRSDTRVFPITANALRLAWERVRERADIDDLHWHDLRHEAVSRFFELGLSVPEVSLISGHKDARMLARYTHLKAEDVAKKLNLQQYSLYSDIIT